MKCRFTFLLIAVSSAATLHADTQFERELKQLREQRDKAVTAANEPINRRYQSSLEQLLRRATQGNDLETALKIKQEMIGPAASPAPGPSAKAEPAPGAINTKREVEKYLQNTTWNLVQTKTGMGWGVMTFKENGVLVFNKDRKWTVANNGKVLLEQYPAEFAKDMKSFKVTWGASGELTATRTAE